MVPFPLLPIFYLWPFFYFYLISIFFFNRFDSFAASNIFTTIRLFSREDGVISGLTDLDLDFMSTWAALCLPCPWERTSFAVLRSSGICSWCGDACEAWRSMTFTWSLSTAAAARCSVDCKTRPAPPSSVVTSHGTHSNHFLLWDILLAWNVTFVQCRLYMITRQLWLRYCQTLSTQ